MLLAKLVGSNGKVLSFEPVPKNCYWIRKSIEANKYKNVKLFSLALSDVADVAGKTIFFLGRRSGWGSLIHDLEKATNKKIIVKTKKLDSILAEQGIKDADVIKIDVEGSEIKVLKGAQKLLKTSKKIKITMDIDTKSEKEMEQIKDLLTNYGFIIYNLNTMGQLDKITDDIADIYAVKEF